MSAYATSLFNYKLFKGKGIVSYASVLFTVTPIIILFIQQSPNKHW